MDIKITKGNKSGICWYNNKINKIYQIDTTFIDKTYFKILHTACFIYKTDCKIFRCDNSCTKHCINCDIGICDMVINKEKENQMEDLDFQIGDEVYDLRYGNGIIDFFQEDNLMVHFLGESSVNQRYSKQGVLFPRITEMKRTLYHGHDLKVVVHEDKPIRFKWVYLCYDEKTYKIITGKPCNTKQEAVDLMVKENRGLWVFVNVYQLIPNHLKEK